MSDVTPNPAGVRALSQVVLATPDAFKIVAALGDPTRWKILQILAPGEALAVRDIAAKLRLRLPSASKHLRILREAGVVACKDGAADRRQTMFSIPAAFRTVPGLVDFGGCVFRLASAKAAFAKD
jgi:DNA-binding transcriptional ArsR family regulator